MLDSAEPLLQPMHPSQEILVLTLERFQPYLETIEPYLDLTDPLFNPREVGLQGLVFSLELVELVNKPIDVALQPPLGRRNHLVNDSLNVGEDDLAVELREDSKGEGLVGHRAHRTPSGIARIAEMASASAGRGERPVACILPQRRVTAGPPLVRLIRIAYSPAAIILGNQPSRACGVFLTVGE